MCGRAVQSRKSIRAGKMLLYDDHQPLEESSDEAMKDDPYETYETDNWNLAPGMQSVVFLLDSASDASTTVHSRIRSSIKTWGIIPKSGTPQSPLPPGPSKHFAHLMYNARSETLFEKRTFRALALNRHTCIWVIDGFFEWAENDKDVVQNINYKQPYYIHRRDNKPLLIAGLFHQVKTGYKRENNQDETLETFTILTTQTCSELFWLNDRQPIILWDTKSALQWLQDPTALLTSTLARIATEESGKWLTWHPVHKQMTHQKYRDAQSIDAIQIEKVPSIKSFLSKRDSPMSCRPDPANHCRNKRKATMDYYLFKKSPHDKITTELIQQEQEQIPQHSRHRSNDLDPMTLSELPKDLLDEILNNKALYLRQNNSKRTNHDRPKGIESYFEKS